MQMSLSLPKTLRGQGVGSKAVAVRNRLVRRGIILLITITLSALFCVWSRVRIVQMGYEVSSLQTEAKELDKKVNHLSVEVERLRSPTRLQKVATKILGMHPPTSEEIVFIKEGSGLLRVEAEVRLSETGDEE